MKRFFYFASFMALAIAATFFTACSDDDDADNKGDNDQPESGDVTSFDQVKYLQNNIVEIDTLGNMIQRVNGAVLNPADTTEVYIGVKDVEAAAEMFKSWLSPDTKVEQISPSTVNMSASLKDEKGVAKETVYFNAAEDGQDIAEMTFASNKVMKHFSKIKFIKETAWPNNEDISPFAVGDIEEHETAHDGNQKWVCIREAKSGVSGLMMYISKDSKRYGTLYIGDFASTSNAKTASKILRGNWQKYVTYFKNAGRTLDDSYYWIDDWIYFVAGGGVYAIKLKNGDIDWFDTVYKRTKHHYIQVRTFGVVSVD